MRIVINTESTKGTPHAPPKSGFYKISKYTTAGPNRSRRKKRGRAIAVFF